MRAVLLLVGLLFLTNMTTTVSDNAYDHILAEDEHVDTHECNVNEFWMDCPSCEQKCGEAPTPCPRVCQPARCHCPAHKGFKRNSSGDCVSKC